MSELLVVGGGITGLSTAMLLASDGHHVTVLERDRRPRPHRTGRGTAWERRRVNAVPPAAPVDGTVP